MSITKTIKLHDDCIGCGAKATGFKFTCVDCTNSLPIRFYDGDTIKKIANHIPQEQKDEFVARYIIKYLQDYKGKIIKLN